MRVHGADVAYNPGADRAAVKRLVGLAFAAKVGDRCAECEDDHVDALLDRPLAYAPYDAARADPDGQVTNLKAPLVRAHAKKLAVTWPHAFLSTHR